MADEHSNQNEREEVTMRAGKRKRAKDSKEVERMFPSKVLKLSSVPFPEINKLMKIAFFRDHVGKNLRVR